MNAVAAFMRAFGAPDNRTTAEVFEDVGIDVLPLPASSGAIAQTFTDADIDRITL